MPRLTPFQQAALDYNNHISLTANAGSGKTVVLANRYVEIAVNENIPLSKIVAITFTEKAAGELNKKISDEIEDRLAKEDIDEKKKILHRIRRQLTSANISTIHSFCINLLKEYSPEAGIDANFAPLNQQDADELLDITIEEFISQNLGQTNYTLGLKNIIRLLGGKNKFVSEIKILVQNRKTLQILGKKLYSQDDEKILIYYNQLINDFLKSIFSNEVAELIKLIVLLNDTILENDGENQIGLEINNRISLFQNEKSQIKKLNHFSILSELLLTKQFTIKKRGYIKKDFEVDTYLIDEIEAGYDELKYLTNISLNENYILSLISFSKQIFRISEKLLEDYDDRKQKAGYLDFEDILLYTKKLTSKENFNELLHDKFEYIMIDEYQDTNEIQYEIFMPILNNLRKGNLFVVGDEKQSIYMFREAELEVFKKTKDEISKINSKGNLLLPHSFRVAPQIAHFTNELFSNLFENPNPDFNEVKYSELICSRNITDKGKIELLINTQEDQKESDFVAHKIFEECSLNENLNWNDFAILCRKRKVFSELEKSLTELGIPFVIAGGKGFYQRQIIYDLYNYISFLINPDDDSALIGILRSPFYSIDDTTIYRITLREGKSFYEKMCNALDLSVQVKHAFELINKHISFASSVRLPALLREIFKSCYYWGVVASGSNYQQEISNLFKLIGVARKFSIQRFKTLYDFKLFLNEAILTMEDEGQAQIADASNAVKIMTLHQAKGLEFKNVFLYKCNEKMRDETVKAKSLSVNKTWGILTKVPVNNSYFSNYVSPAVVEINNYIETKKQIAEAKRLFYVGITRAIDNLYLTATVSENKIAKNSFLKFLLNGLNIDLQNDEHILNSSLQFMSDVSEDFKLFTQPFTTKLKISHSIKINNDKKIERKKILPFVKMNTQLITDHEKNEIVSATKIAIFTQCPTKYYLTYELGYTELFKLTKSIINDYDFKYNEDTELNIFADVRGLIIHKILEAEIPPDTLEEKINELLLSFKNRIGIKHEEFKNKINSEIMNYYESDTYTRLMSYKNYINEFEIYSKESDYYVYGIIDKLVLEKDRVVIIDYKTDNITEDKITSKAEHYLPQLKFYAYSVAKLYKELNEIIVELVFLKHPEKSVQYSFKRNEVIKFGKEIEQIVKMIRDQKFTKNLNHCSKCHFSINKQCIFQT